MVRELPFRNKGRTDCARSTTANLLYMLYGHSQFPPHARFAVMMARLMIKLCCHSAKQRSLLVSLHLHIRSTLYALWSSQSLVAHTLVAKAVLLMIRYGASS